MGRSNFQNLWRCVEEIGSKARGGAETRLLGESGESFEALRNSEGRRSKSTERFPNHGGQREDRRNALLDDTAEARRRSDGFSRGDGLSGWHQRVSGRRAGQGFTDHYLQVTVQAVQTVQAVAPS